jgi:hypothetical protein
MQQIALTKHLKEIPIPENWEDILLIKDESRVYPEVFRPIPYLDGLCFNTVITDYTNAKYEVIKITAKEADFKVGDRVKFAALVFWIRGTINAIHSDANGNWAEVAVSDTNIQNVYLTDLTLITE